MARDFRLGIVGAGGFGLFALQHFTQVEGIKLVAMAGTHREAAFAAAKRFGVPDIEDVDHLVARDDVDLIYIATPPFLHYSAAIKALANRKHVICEKPLALTVPEGTELVKVASEQGLVMVADLMQRYNPLYGQVDELIRSELLGKVLHGYFENYASDEGLTPEHWFWDRSKSGGIFIEHGVHFFDMLDGWLGPGKVLSAQRTLRPGTDLEEQVNCTVEYPQGALVNFYHSFTQPSRMDRQELRLVFELGDITLTGWIPTKAHIRGLVDEGATKALVELFSGARLDITETYLGPNRKIHYRHKSRDAFQRVDIRYGDEVEKLHRYGELLRSMMSDQLAWIRDPLWERRVTEKNGLDSLTTAVRASELASVIA